MVKEEQEEGNEEVTEGEEEGRTGQFGRFVLRVRDVREKCGFTVTDIDVQVKTQFHGFSGCVDEPPHGATFPVIQEQSANVNVCSSPGSSVESDTTGSPPGQTITSPNALRLC